jgi:hypothetical protein
MSSFKVLLGGVGEIRLYERSEYIFERECLHLLARNTSSNTIVEQSMCNSTYSPTLTNKKNEQNVRFRFLLAECVLRKTN